jgi:hypothetical protein
VSAPLSPELRGEVERAVLDAVERAGSCDIDRAAIVAAFAARGVARSTAFRWIAAALESGAAGVVLCRKLREAAEGRATAAGVPVPERPAESAEAEAALAAAQLPAPVAVHEIVGCGSAIDVMAKIRACIEVCEGVMAHAKTPDGGPRLPKLLLAATDKLRRCLDTAVHLSREIREASEVDRFHQAIMEEVAKESPDCAARIVARMSAVAGRYGA